MKNLLVILFVFLGSASFANDAYVRTAGGVVLPFSETKNLNISMSSEIITITLFEDYYNINVDFTFYNNGKTEILKVGFPEWRNLQPTNDNFINFTTTLNGSPINFISEKPSKPDALGEYIEITKWYTREINFPEKSETRTSVSYDAPYGVYGLDESIDYLFGTANSWNGVIGSFAVNVVNKSEYWINGIQIGSLKNFVVQTTDSGIKILENNISPQNDSCIFIEINHVPDILVSNRIISFERNWDLDKIVLNSQKLMFYNKQQLKILRNLIFAGHGNIFQSSDINIWLKIYASEWYKPLKKVDVSELNDIERKNIELIQNEETKR